MLHRFLRILRDGQMQSLLEIARQLDITPGMVLQIADQLSRQGYLQEVIQECSNSDHPCNDCLVGSTCQTAMRRWALTEKGERVVTASLSPSQASGRPIS